MLHPLLRRQLKRLGIQAETTPPTADQWQKFLAKISQSYTEADQDRYLLERSLTISSEEMQELYEQLRQTAETQLIAERDKLKKAEQDYRTIFENSPLGVYRSSLDGRQLRANPALVKLNGYNTEEEMKAAVKNLATEWYVEPTRRDEFIRLVEEHGYITNFESEVYRHKTRERIWVSETGLLIRDQHGAPLYYEGTVQDITARKQMEEVLILTRDQALAASRLKTELLAKVSHELRTPLNAILGFTELLEIGRYGPVSNTQKEILREIIDNAEYQKRLVNELLDQAQLETGQLKVNITSFAPAHVINGTLTNLSVLAANKNLTLTITIADDMPSILFGDLTRLQQILVNLVGNAIKFTETGSIRVHLFRPDRDHWALCVADTGPGIPPEAHELIFESFRQVDGSVTRRYGGAGLGLSIVKQLTRLMGGQITLKSEVGQGSTFTVILPLNIVEQALG
jgi:PAS domain S-box-containing protein